MSMGRWTIFPWKCWALLANIAHSDSKNQPIVFTLQWTLEAIFQQIPRAVWKGKKSDDSEGEAWKSSGRKRKFVRSWTNNFPWLQFDDKKMLCKLCRGMVTESALCLALLPDALLNRICLKILLKKWRYYFTLPFISFSYVWVTSAILK